MNLKEKIISYGKEHPKDKKMIIIALAVIIFAENIKKSIHSGVKKGFGKNKLELEEGDIMNEYEELSGGYRTSVRNVEYDSEQVKRQLKPVNHVVVIPIALICIVALAMTGIAGNADMPAKVSASAGQENLLKSEEAESAWNVRETEAEIVAKTETQTQSYVTEDIVIDNEDLPWYLMLINDDYAVASDYDVELVYVEGKKVDARIKESLKEMLSAARAAGMKCKICSGYRTYEKQESLVKKDVAKYKAKGYDDEDALRLTYLGVAPAGHSEHQTGLAVDIVSSYHQSLDAAHANTKEAIWLKEHCKEYGFIVRYMEGKEDITHRKAESWHFRFVGVEAATYIMENDITLEEYLEEYITNN